MELGRRNEGWICAKCGRSYAPFVHECRDCNGRGNALSGVSTSHPDVVRVEPTAGDMRPKPPQIGVWVGTQELGGIYWPDLTMDSGTSNYNLPPGAMIT